MPKQALKNHFIAMGVYRYVLCVETAWSTPGEITSSPLYTVVYAKPISNSKNAVFLCCASDA